MFYLPQAILFTVIREGLKMNSLAFRTIFCFVLLVASNVYAYIFSTEYGSDYKSNSIEFLKGGSEYYVKFNFLLSERQYISELFRLSDGRLLLKDKVPIDLVSSSVVDVFISELNIEVVKYLESHYETGKGKVVVYEGGKIYFRVRGHCELFDKAYLQLTDSDGDLLDPVGIILDREFDYELDWGCFESGDSRLFHVNGVSLSIRQFWDVGDGYLYAAVSEYPILLKLKITGNNIEPVFLENQDSATLISIKGVF